MITILSGSARKNSNTLKVAKAVGKILEAQNETCSVIDFYGYDVPNYNEDFNPAQLSEWQQRAHDDMQRSRLVFFISPEYNWLPTAEIIQFINRFSDTKFKSIWNDCTFATIGISAGIGGRLPALTLKNTLDEIIAFHGTTGRTISALQEVHRAQVVIDEEGNLQDNEPFNNSFTTFVLNALAQSH